MAHNGRCQFEHNGALCPLPGNSSDSPSAGGTWYCLYHRHGQNRSHDLAQDEHFRIFSDPACVRDWLELHYGETVKREGLRLLRDNKDWRRQPDESRSEYVARVRALHKQLRPGLKRMPV